MSKQIFIALLFSIFPLYGAMAQENVPTPSPTPMNVQDVTDKQDVAPENLQGVPDVASDYSSLNRNLPDLGRVGVDMTNQKSLTLQDAISLALENNKDIEVTRKNIKIAEFDLQNARGVYEPKFSGDVHFERTKTPVFSFFGGGPDGSLTQTNLVGTAGIQGLIRQTGGSYSATVDSGKNTTNNLFSLVDPTYTSNLRFSITQPIFRGRKSDQNRRTIEIAKRNVTMSDVQFRQRSIDIITTVQRSYWDLVYALRNLQVQRDGVRDAKDQLEHNQRLVKEGQLAPIDIVAAETQVANFELAVYDALNAVTISENILKNLISPNRNAVIWSESVTPVDSVRLDVPVISLADAIETAMQNRPELEINKTQKDINAIDQTFLRNQNKPQVDLVASYTMAGAAGPLAAGSTNPFNNTAILNDIISRVNLISSTTNPGETPIPPIPVNTQSLPNNLIGGYGNSVSNMFANRYPTFRVGVQFNLPVFGNKSAGAQLGKSRVEGERLETQREQLEQNIQVEVRNALQLLRTAESRLRTAAIARENSEKQYESEQRKLDAGQSDIYKVLERQTALTNARSNELRSQTELNKAIADLYRAIGSSLKINNIETISPR